MNPLMRYLLPMLFATATSLHAGELATLGTENYPANMSNPWLHNQPVVAVAPYYWSTTPQPVGLPPMVWVHPMATPRPNGQGYVGSIVAPVYVNYQLWTR